MIPAVRVGIITCPRMNGYEYLHATVEDMFKRQPGLDPSQVKVFADALDPPTGLPEGIEVECSTQKRLDEIKEFGLFGTMNLIRSLRWASEGTEYAVTLEDDIIFANDWLTRALAVGRKLSEVVPGQKFILALSHWLDVEKDFDTSSERSVGSDKAILWHPIWDATPQGTGVVNPLSGSQSYLQSSQIARHVADRLNGAMRYPARMLWRWVMDCGVNAYCCLEKSASLWSVHPCLTQHVGAVSVAGSGTDPGSLHGNETMSMYFDDPNGSFSITQIDRTYSAHFFYKEAGYAERAASAIVPLMAQRHSIESVIDIGCGTGEWCRAMLLHGASRVVGVDSQAAARARSNVPARCPMPDTIEFFSHDLSLGMPVELVGQRFGLAICLEVAEHLPPEIAPRLVVDICKMSDVVLWSAAVPGQGGDGHINEQPEQYWEQLFGGHGYRPDYWIRNQLQGDNYDDVAIWYKNNVMVYKKVGSP